MEFVLERDASFDPYSQPPPRARKIRTRSAASLAFEDANSASAFASERSTSSTSRLETAPPRASLACISAASRFLSRAARRRLFSTRSFAYCVSALSVSRSAASTVPSNSASATLADASACSILARATLRLGRLQEINGPMLNCSAESLTSPSTVRDDTPAEAPRPTVG